MKNTWEQRLKQCSNCKYYSAACCVFNAPSPRTRRAGEQLPPEIEVEWPVVRYSSLCGQFKWRRNWIYYAAGRLRLWLYKIMYWLRGANYE